MPRAAFKEYYDPSHPGHGPSRRPDSLSTVTVTEPQACRAAAAGGLRVVTVTVQVKFKST